MRLEIQTNRTPIIAGDVIGLVIHTDFFDLYNTSYSLDLVPGGRRLASLGPINPHFDWTVDAIGQLQVVATARILGFTTKSEISGPFVVLPAAPHVTAPQQNELLAAGSSYTFRWTQNRPLPNTYRIFFSVDGGDHFEQLGNEVPGTDLQASRHIPGTPTDDGRVRVEALFAGEPPVSFGDFPVRTTASPVIKVSSPAPHTIWRIGDAETISWVASGQVTSFKISLSRGSGHPFTTIFSDVDGATRHVLLGRTAGFGELQGPRRSPGAARLGLGRQQRVLRDQAAALAGSPLDATCETTTPERTGRPALSASV